MGVCLQKCALNLKNPGEVVLDSGRKLQFLTTLSEKPLASNVIIQSAIRGYLTRKSLIFKNTAVLGKILRKKHGLSWISLEKFPDGVYTGQVKEGIREGLGELVIAPDIRYYGYFKLGLYHGSGVFCEKNQIFEGKWVRGVKQGYGIWKSEGLEYEGDWKNNNFHGKGKENWYGQCVYIGDFVNGKKEGFGKCEFFNGNFYTGEFKNNLFCGIGEFYWANKKKTYTGSWDNGKMSGQGMILWENGKKFIGFFQNGAKHGFGKYIHNGKTKRYYWELGVKKSSKAYD